MEVYAVIYIDRWGLTKHKETKIKKTAIYWKIKYNGEIIYLYTI